jgi:outer membrane protein assembly factor BamB
LPSTWSPTENVAWKLPLPAFSGSTPIIWGDRIFLNVATARDTGALELWAIDRIKQDVAWKRPLAGGNNLQRKQNMSSPSPVTDGKRVWVMTGVGILKSFDFDGKELWARDIQKDYGHFGLNWGYASSPLLHQNALYVQVLHGMKTNDPSYVLRIDADSGKTLWRQERLTDAPNESPDSYTTPTVVEHRGPHRTHHHGWRRRVGPRSRHRQGTLARHHPESDAALRLSHRGVAARRRGADHRPIAQ